MGDLSILQRLDQIEKLPTLPVVVNQINQLIGSNRSNMTQIATVIARDQSIASRVIRLVNSAFYGLQGKVSSIQQAITLLGLNTVRNIVTGVAVVKVFEASGNASIFDRQKFWLHTFACALLSKGIARARRCAEPENYFMSGLLHDIGILVMDQFFHSEFVEIIHECLKTKTTFTDAEQEIIATTHCAIGDYLANKWHIPDIIAVGIKYHHNPMYALNETASNLDMLFTIHVADAFTQNKGYHTGLQGALPRASQVALHRLGISENEILSVWEEISPTITNVMREWDI